MSARDEARLRDELFAEFENVEMRELNDLTISLWAAMTERMSAREFMAVETDTNGMQREIAKEIFWAAVTHKNLTTAQRDCLFSVCHGLVDSNARWRFRLTYTRKGNRHSALQDMQRMEQARQIVEFLESTQLDGQKFESAIADACAEFEVSRATAFRAWQHRDNLNQFHGRADKIIGIDEMIAEQDGRFQWWRKMLSRIRRLFQSSPI